MDGDAGDIGLQLDLTVRAGDTLGPYELTLTNLETGEAVDLTGSTIEGAVIAMDDETEVAPLTVTLTAPEDGVCTFEVADDVTADFSAQDFFQAARTYRWYLRMVDTASKTRSLFFGYVNTAREL